MGARIQLVLAIQRVGNEGCSKSSCNWNVHDDVSKLDWNQRNQLLLPYHLQVAWCVEYFDISLCNRYLWHRQDVHDRNFIKSNSANNRLLRWSGFLTDLDVGSSSSLEDVVLHVQCFTLQPTSLSRNPPVKRHPTLADMSLL